MKLRVLPKSFRPKIISKCKLTLQWKIVTQLLENDLHALKNVYINYFIF